MGGQCSRGEVRREEPEVTVVMVNQDQLCPRPTDQTNGANPSAGNAMPYPVIPMVPYGTAMAPATMNPDGTVTLKMAATGINPPQQTAKTNDQTEAIMKQILDRLQKEQQVMRDMSAANANWYRDGPKQGAKDDNQQFATKMAMSTDSLAKWSDDSSSSASSNAPDLKNQIQKKPKTVNETKAKGKPVKQDKTTPEPEPTQFLLAKCTGEEGFSFKKEDFASIASKQSIEAGSTSVFTTTTTTCKKPKEKFKAKESQSKKTKSGSSKNGSKTRSTKSRSSKRLSASSSSKDSSKSSTSLSSKVTSKRGGGKLNKSKAIAALAVLGPKPIGQSALKPKPKCDSTFFTNPTSAESDGPGDRPFPKAEAPSPKGNDRDKTSSLKEKSKSRSRRSVKKLPNKSPQVSTDPVSAPAVAVDGSKRELDRHDSDSILQPSPLSSGADQVKGKENKRLDKPDTKTKDTNKSVVDKNKKLNSSEKESVKSVSKDSKNKSMTKVKKSPVSSDDSDDGGGKDEAQQKTNKTNKKDTARKMDSDESDDGDD